jgi:hypothetical protein
MNGKPSRMTTLRVQGFISCTHLRISVQERKAASQREAVPETEEERLKRARNAAIVALRKAQAPACLHASPAADNPPPKSPSGEPADPASRGKQKRGSILLSDSDEDIELAQPAGFHVVSKPAADDVHAYQKADFPLASGSSSTTVAAKAAVVDRVESVAAGSNSKRAHAGASKSRGAHPGSTKGGGLSSGNDGHKQDRDKGQKGVKCVVARFHLGTCQRSCGQIQHYLEATDSHAAAYLFGPYTTSTCSYVSSMSPFGLVVHIQK